MLLAICSIPLCSFSTLSFTTHVRSATFNTGLFVEYAMHFGLIRVKECLDITHPLYYEI